MKLCSVSLCNASKITQEKMAFSDCWNQHQDLGTTKKWEVILIVNHPKHRCPAECYTSSEALRDPGSTNHSRFSCHIHWDNTLGSLGKQSNAFFQSHLKRSSCNPKTHFQTSICWPQENTYCNCWKCSVVFLSLHPLGRWTKSGLILNKESLWMLTSKITFACLLRLVVWRDCSSW